MPPFVRKTLQLIILVLLPVVTVVGIVRVLTTDAYLAYEYGKASFPADVFALPTGSRLALASSNFAYVRLGLPIGALASQSIGVEPVYNERELAHMLDVQRVYRTATSTAGWSLGLILLAGFVLGLSAETRPALARAVRAGGLWTAALAGAVGLFAGVAWSLWFGTFHVAFFRPGTWTFPFSDMLVRLFPEQFWVDTTAALLALTIVSGLLIAFAGQLALRRWNRSESRAPHSPSLQEIAHGKA
jgi:integral membrane protein (TIGR01906 family)